MLKRIQTVSTNFIKETEGKTIQIISHFDTDGITSAAILTKALKKLDRPFLLKIIKQLDKPFISGLRKIPTVFLDLGSNNLSEISNQLEQVWILDHHEIPLEIPEKIIMINPHLFNNEQISSAGITYLFAKELIGKNAELATLATIGMIGDMLDQSVSIYTKQIIEDSETIVKRGLLLYPSTRPVNKALEYSSNIFIPNVTGNSEGALELIRRVGIGRNGKGYKSLMELDDNEQSRLLTEIAMVTKKSQIESLIGNIYLLKFFDRIEDGRTISSMINACSRLDSSDIAICLCLGCQSAKEKVEALYASYRQHIVSALKYVASCEKISSNGYVIINAHNEIKDTIIGTVASILSSSSEYNEGTVIATMAYSHQEQIKVSMRVAGRKGRNVHETLSRVVEEIGGEVGGHHLAAGCLILKENEKPFIEMLQKALEVEMVKV